MDYDLILFFTPLVKMTDKNIVAGPLFCRSHQPYCKWDSEESSPVVKRVFFIELKFFSELINMLGQLNTYGLL